MAFGVVNSDCSEECARIEVTLHGPSCRNPLLHTLLFCTLSSSQNTQRYGSQDLLTETSPGESVDGLVPMSHVPPAEA